MSELARMYGDLRAEGRGHYEAVRALARKLGVDQNTVIRVLRRATEESQRRRPRQ